MDNIFIGIIEDHPMFPTFADVLTMMGHAANHPEDTKSWLRLEIADQLAHTTYAEEFAKAKRSREEFVLFIASLMTIYHHVFIEKENVKKKTENAPTLVKRNSKGR